MKSVACIVVNWNKKDNVIKLIIRIQKKVILPGNVNLDIIVIDNNSSDGSRETIEEHFPDVKVINTGDNLGGSGAFSRGFEYAMANGYDYIWTQDNDAYPSSGLLVKYIEASEKYDNKVIVGGTMCVLESPFLINESGSFIGEYGNLILHLHRERYTYKKNHKLSHCEVEYVAFASAFFPARLVDVIGNLQDFFIHYDDVDFCVRARKAGYRIIALYDALYWHESYQAKPVTWIKYYDVRNRLYLCESFGQSVLKKTTKRIMLSVIKNAILGRVFFADVIFMGLDDFYKRKYGKKDIKAGNVKCYHVNSTDVDEILSLYRTKNIIVDFNSFVDLFKSHRDEWFAFLNKYNSRANFYMLKYDGKFYLEKMAGFGFDDMKVTEIFLPRISDEYFKEIMAEGIFISSDERVKKHLRLKMFSTLKKRLWMHGSFIIDYNFGSFGLPDVLNLISNIMKRLKYAF